MIENALLVSNIVLISHPSFHHLRPINKVQTSYKCWNIYDDQPVNKIKHIYNPVLPINDNCLKFRVIFYVNNTKRNLTLETSYLWMRHGVKLAKFGHADVVTMQHTYSSFISMAITIIWCTENCDNLQNRIHVIIWGSYLH